MTTVAPVEKQEPAAAEHQGAVTNAEGPNIAAIVIPIVALLAIIGGIAGVVGSGMLG